MQQSPQGSRQYLAASRSRELALSSSTHEQHLSKTHLQQGAQGSGQHVAAGSILLRNQAQHKGHEEQGRPLRLQPVGQLPYQRLQG